MFFAISSIRHSSRWGTRRSMWSKVNEPSVQIPFYTANSGAMTINIQTEEGVTLKSMEQEAVKGLNYVKYDLTLAEKGVKVLEKTLNMDLKKGAKKREIKAAKDNNAFYLAKGTYQIELLKNGQSVTQKLVVK